MKRITLALIVLLAGCLTANAQFTLEMTGLVITEKPKQDFIVLDFGGKTQQELYQAVNVYLHSLYVNPQNVLSSVENQAITINGKGKITTYWDVTYTISLAFKDGRIRINIPTILKLSADVNGVHDEKAIVGTSFLGQAGGVFDRKGKLLLPKMKTAVEDYFNGYISKLVTAANGYEGNNNNDW